MEFAMIALVALGSMILGYSIVEVKGYLKRRRTLNRIEEALLKDISC